VGTHRFEIHVDAPPEVVFDLWTDPDRVHEWIEGLTGVTGVTGPIDQPGTRYTVHFGRMKSVTEVLIAERPRRYVTRFGNALLRGENDATFEPDDGGTRLSQTFRTRGAIPAITARIFATGSYRGSFRGELLTFAALAKRDAASMAG
jgi:uncharacterized protein YndB with AHSA1/START domain